MHIDLWLLYPLDKLTPLSLHNNLFVSCYSFGLNLYIVLYKSSYFCSLLVSIYTEYLFYLFSLSPCVSLKMNWVSFMQHLAVSCFVFLIYPATPCILIRVLNPFRIRIFLHMRRLTNAILLPVIRLFCNSLFLSPLPAFLCELIFHSGMLLFLFLLLCTSAVGFALWLPWGWHRTSHGNNLFYTDNFNHIQNSTLLLLSCFWHQYLHLFILFIH